MMEFIILVICLSTTFYFAVVVKMYKMGMKLNLALIRSFIYPFNILFLHCRVFKHFKNESLLLRIKLLLMPIYSPQETVNKYTYMHLRRDATYKIIDEMLENTKDEDKKVKILDILEKEGVIKRVYKKSIISSEDGYMTNDHFSNVKKYRYKMG